MKVHYDNGDIQEVFIRMLIPMNGESRVINLEGGLRHLQRLNSGMKRSASTLGNPGLPFGEDVDYITFGEAACRMQSGFFMVPSCPLFQGLKCPDYLIK